ncbi:MAG: DUF2071 domain-containing protein [Armatimonadota bacterium]
MSENSEPEPDADGASRPDETSPEETPVPVPSEALPVPVPDPTPDASVPTGIFARLKNRLEAPEKGAATITGTLRDYLVVTWAVPADKVRPQVPAELPLDVLPNASGELTAFLQVVCFYGENIHWSPLQNDPLAQSYHQVTYRLLTRYKNKRGAFNLRSYFSTEEVRNTQRVVAREVDYARFFVHINGDPARNTYSSYNLRAVGDRGQTSVEVTFDASEAAETTSASTPFADFDEMAQYLTQMAVAEDAEKAAIAVPVKAVPIPAPFSKFEDMSLFLTQREEVYFASSAPKTGIGLTPVHHEPLQPRSGILKSARASLFTDQKLLTPEDLLQPVAVLLQPSFTLTTYPPRLARFEE